MRFHLVYRGPLRASANNSKTADVTKVREYFHPQLVNLWNTHNALKVLAAEGAMQTGGDVHSVIIGADGIPRKLTPRELVVQGHPSFTDCIPPLLVGDRSYLPLVRESLHLACELEILFLRQQDPGALLDQGGDIDGRIKLLLDALRMPDKQEQDIAPPSVDGEIYCLLQNDTLVSRLDVDTDRLLVPETEDKKEVHLVIAVSLNVLRVRPYNVCLL
jgi:hypothetical protein